MKKTFLSSIRIAALAIALSGAAFASAWTGPTSTFPGGNVDAPVNTGTVSQTKKSSLTLTENLFVTGATMPIGGGNITAVNSVMSYWGFFTDMVTALKGQFGCNKDCDIANTNFLTAGKYIGKLLNSGLWVSSDGLTSVGHPDGTTSTNGNVLDLHGASNQPEAVIISNKQTISLYSYLTNRAAHLKAQNIFAAGNMDIAGTIRIGGGNPGANKVLASITPEGNAAWGNLKMDTENMIDIRYVRAMDSGSPGNSTISIAYCPDDYQLISGGGACGAAMRSSEAVPALDAKQYNYKSNGVGQTLKEAAEVGLANYQENSTSGKEGWRVDCQQGAGQHSWALAICMKVTPPKVVVEAVPPGPSTSGWTKVSAGSLRTGQKDQTCLAWLQSLYPDKGITSSDIRIYDTNGYRVGYCGYRGPGIASSITSSANKSPSDDAYPTSDYSLEIFFD